MHSKDRKQCSEGFSNTLDVRCLVASAADHQPKTIGCIWCQGAASF